METVPNLVVVPQFEPSPPSSVPHSPSAPASVKPPGRTQKSARPSVNQKAFNELFSLVRQGAKELLECTDGRSDGAAGFNTGRESPSTPLTPEQIFALLDESELESMAKISNTIGHNIARIMFMADGRGDRANHRSRSRLRRRLCYTGSSRHNKVMVFSSTSHRHHYRSSTAPSVSLTRTPAVHQEEEHETNEDDKEPAELRQQVVCHECRTETTPRWRKGPDGPGTLCNFCGLLYAKRTRRLVGSERSVRRRARRIR